MNTHIHMFFKRFFLALLAVGFSGLFLAPACEDKEAEIERHRPRRDRPLLQVLPPEPKPLLGLFVDVNSKAAAPDGKSWSTAFKTIQDGINASKGQDIYVAAGTYNSPNLNLRDRVNIRLVGGYKAGEKFEKDRTSLKADEWVVLDGQGLANHLVLIAGNAERISFAGGFEFKNTLGASAVTIQGTALNAPVKEISIINSKFTNNHNNAIAGNGGGVDAQYVKDLRLDNLMAENNQTTHQGGFLRITDVEGVSLIGGTWKANVAEDGGALYLARASHVSFFGQTVEANRANLGAGIYIDKLRDQTIRDITFTGNRGVPAPVSAGAGLFVKDCRGVTVLNSGFINNKLDLNLANWSFGGAISIQDSVNITLNFGAAEIKDSQAIDGGAIAVSQAGMPVPENIVINGGRFSNNQALRNGGAVYSLNTNGLTLQNMYFDAHKATNGGTLFISTPAGMIRFKNLDIRNGSAQKIGAAAAAPLGIAQRRGSAGGIFIQGIHPTPGLPPTNIILENSRLIGNKAVGNGGAFMASDITYKIEINDTEFSRNTTENFGGALALDGHDVSARFIIGQNTKFHSNYARRGAGGGAIYALFDQNAAVGPLLLAEQRQLVFYNTINDRRDNVTGQVIKPAVVANTAGLYGNFMRVAGYRLPPAATLAIESVAVHDLNPAARVFLPIPPPPPLKLLPYFIAYSLNPADNTRPWNQLGIGWENEIDVYAW